MIPENAGYFHAAYIAAAVIYVGYVVSLWRRRRHVRRRLDALLARGERKSESPRERMG